MIATCLTFLIPSHMSSRDSKRRRAPISKYLTSIHSELRKPRGFMFAAFIDFRKAFDTISREKLVTKLANNFNMAGYLPSSYKLY